MYIVDFYTTNGCEDISAGAIFFFFVFLESRAMYTLSLI